MMTQGLETLSHFCLFFDIICLVHLFLNLDIFFFSIGNRTWIAVIARYGGCTFEEKVRNAMNANYSAAIVYNVDSNKVILEEVTLFNRLILLFQNAFQMLSAKL